MAEGHSAGQIILQLHDIIIPSEKFTDTQKAAVCERLAVSSNLVVFVWDGTE